MTLTGAAVVRANTIQPILVSETGPVAGLFTYNFDIQLTPNDYLQNTAATPTNFPSSVTILDFGVVSGTPTLTGGTGLLGADATAVSDWATPSTNLTGGAPLPNATFAAGNFLLFGSDASIAGAPDSALMTNVTLEYTGAGLAADPLLQRSLVQLHIVTSLPPGVQTRESVSLDGNAFTNVQQPSTFSVQTAVPEPTSLGLLGIGAAGLLLRRRR